MKRDLDLCRTLLLELEEDPAVTGMKNLEVDGVTEEQVSYHVKLLHEAGLIEAHDASALNSFRWYPIRLTWQGHEFLDAARDEARWDKAKAFAREKTGSLAFEFVKVALFKVAGL